MKNRAEKPDVELAVKAVDIQPEDVTDLLNKYGTYNIQPTAASDNKYPAIAQKGAINRKDR